MSDYHVKVVKGQRETVYPCSGYTVTVRPEGSGSSDQHYVDHPEIVGLPPEGYFDDKPNPNNTPEGQTVKLELNGPDQPVIYLPRDGKIAYIMNEKGDTIDTYPKRKHRTNGAGTGVGG